MELDEMKTRLEDLFKHFLNKNRIPNIIIENHINNELCININDGMIIHKTVGECGTIVYHIYLSTAKHNYPHIKTFEHSFYTIGMYSFAEETIRKTFSLFIDIEMESYEEGKYYERMAKEHKKFAQKVSSAKSTTLH